MGVKPIAPMKPLHVHGDVNTHSPTHEAEETASSKGSGDIQSDAKRCAAPQVRHHGYMLSMLKCPHS